MTVLLDELKTWRWQNLAGGFAWEVCNGTYGWWQDYGEAYAWAEENGVLTLADAWARCDRPNWLLRLVERRHIELDESKLRLFACDLAESVLPLFEKEHPNVQGPRRAIETSRRFARREASEADLAKAEEAAKNVAAGVKGIVSIWTAWAAADVARATFMGAKYTACDFVRSIANDTVYATVASAEDTGNTTTESAVRASAREWQSNRLRAYFPWPFEAPHGQLS